MKQLIKLQQDVLKKSDRIKALYGLDYIGTTDDYSISTKRGTASMYASKYDDEPKITMSCGDKETPTTYEEFIQAKRQHQLDVDHVKHVWEIWKKANV